MNTLFHIWQGPAIISLNTSSAPFSPHGQTLSRCRRRPEALFSCMNPMSLCSSSLTLSCIISTMRLSSSSEIFILYFSFIASPLGHPPPHSVCLPSLPSPPCCLPSLLIPGWRLEHCLLGLVTWHMSGQTRAGSSCLSGIPTFPRPRVLSKTKPPRTARHATPSPVGRVCASASSPTAARAHGSALQSSHCPGSVWPRFGRVLLGRLVCFPPGPPTAFLQAAAHIWLSGPGLAQTWGPSSGTPLQGAPSLSVALVIPDSSSQLETESSWFAPCLGPAEAASEQQTERRRHRGHHQPQGSGVCVVAVPCGPACDLSFQRLVSVHGAWSFSEILCRKCPSSALFSHLFVPSSRPLCLFCYLYF